MCGSCEVIQTVYWPVAGSYVAAAPRASIGFGIRRWLTSRCLTTTSASASALSVASASPTDQSMTMLPGAFSCSWGAPSAGRLFDVDDDVERLVLDLDQRERVLGRVLALGHDGRDAGAGERDPVDLEHARRVDEVLDAAGLPRARQAGRSSKSLPVKTATTPGARGRLRRVDRS